LVHIPLTFFELPLLISLEEMYEEPLKLHQQADDKRLEA
jgi:hypothetical protein